MSDPAQLSVTSVVALVLGGVAAFVLALVIALGGYGHGGAKKEKVSTASSAQPASSAAPAASGGLHELETEYPLEWDEPTQEAGKR
jgi:hypothetical protein